MIRLLSLILLTLLLSAYGPGELCAQSAAPAQADTAKAQKPKTARTGKAAAAKARTDKQAAAALLKKTRLSQEDLTKPYSAGAFHGPPAPESKTDADNASSLSFDPTPKARPFAKKEQDSPINLRIGGETIVDPLTKTEVKRQPDAASAKKDSDLKGTLDKVGGKAEVQVDILKF